MFLYGSSHIYSDRICSVQLADALAVTAYAFAMSLTLLVILEPLIYCFSTRNQRGQTRKFEYLENTRTTDTYVLMEGPGREQDRMTEVLFRQ